jgi:hypothetical protein
VAIARVGDVFDLGPHRLICDSATDPETLRRLMEGDPSARLVLTDEPYNVGSMCLANSSATTRLNSLVMTRLLKASTSYVISSGA